MSKWATVKVEVLIEESELWSRVFGAEPFSFGSHWRKVEWLEGDWDVPGRVRLTCENDGDGEGYEYATTTVEVDMSAILEALTKCPAHIVSEIIDDNADCVSADYVLQTAVLGEVIWG